MTTGCINIHTHRQGQADDICIRNILLSDIPDDKSYRESPYSVGIHPWYLENSESVKAGIETILLEIGNKHCVALGECGLDKVTQTPMVLQIEAFKAQVRLAEKYNKPLIIHCVKAYNEILKLRKTLHANSIWIFHGFNSSIQIAEQIIDSGCLISFGHHLLQPNSKAVEVLPTLDPEDFFLETDDHDISIADVYTRAAKIREISVEKLCNQQLKNYQALLND